MTKPDYPVRHWIYNYVTAGNQDLTPSGIIRTAQLEGLDARRELLYLLTNNILTLKTDGTVGHRVLQETDYVRFYKRIKALTEDGKRTISLVAKNPVMHEATCQWKQTADESMSDLSFSVTGTGSSALAAVADLYHKMTIGSSHMVDREHLNE